MKKQANKILCRPHLTRSQILILILYLLKEVQSKSFQTSVGSVMVTLEEAIITNCKFKTSLQGTDDKRYNTFVFVNTLLKNRVSSSENELSKKDAIFDFTSKQIVFTTGKNYHAHNARTNFPVNGITVPKKVKIRQS